MDQSEIGMAPINGRHIRIQTEKPSTTKKWPNGFWAILKLMCLFYHRTVVPRRKTCYGCTVDKFKKRIRAGAVQDMDSSAGEMEPMLVQYEFQDPRRVEGRGADGEDTPLMEQEESACPVCDTLWWNQDGLAERYSEGNIGIGRWNHRGSGPLSLLLLLGALTFIIYDIVNFLDKLWGKPDLILRMMIKMTLYIILIIYPLLSLCSKLRSILPTALANLRWASVLNVRYLIKRGQILGIGRKGLPGKMLLFLFQLTTLIVALYRFLIFTVISKCGFNWSTIVTSLIGVIYGQWYGLYMYLIYFVRISFQREFNLLLIYVRENEGSETRCRGAFFATVLDFLCFKQLVNLSIFVMFPALVFAVSGNITYEYLLSNTTCVADDELNRSVAHHTLRLAWSEVFVSLVSYLVAMGGVHAEYIFDNFVGRLLHLRSGRNWIFWSNLNNDITYVTKNSHFLLVTTIFSFISIFMAFNFGTQDITDLAFCNDTMHEDLCV